jgi:hypothetical protein
VVLESLKTDCTNLNTAPTCPHRPYTSKLFRSLFQKSLVIVSLIEKKKKRSCCLLCAELMSHERVIAELEKDTQSTCAGLGLPPGTFSCGHFPQFFVVEVKVSIS